MGIFFQPGAASSAPGSAIATALICKNSRRFSWSFLLFMNFSFSSGPAAMDRSLLCYRGSKSAVKRGQLVFSVRAEFGLVTFDHFVVASRQPWAEGWNPARIHGLTSTFK